MNLYRLLRKLAPRIAANYQKGIGPTRVVLLLTTIGRKSGLPRVTPLQYEEIDGVYYIGSARGTRSDWFRNIQANPCVELQIRERHLQGTAEPVCDPQRMADFFAVRLKRSPLFIGLVMHLEGLPLRYRREDLVRFAQNKAMVIVRPVG